MKDINGVNIDRNSSDFFIAGNEFIPSRFGVGETWGLLIEGATGDVVLQVKSSGDNWHNVQTFTENGAHVDRLSVNRTYRVNPANATAVFLL